MSGTESYSKINTGAYEEVWKFDSEATLQTHGPLLWDINTEHIVLFMQPNDFFLITLCMFHMGFHYT